MIRDKNDTRRHKNDNGYDRNMTPNKKSLRFGDVFECTFFSLFWGS